MTDHQDDCIAITEQITDWRLDGFDVRIDERTVSRVRLCGGESKNGHRYSEIALREAAGLYDRKPVFLDHAPNLAKPYDRSTRDLAGWITDARFADGEISGDIRVIDTEAGQTLLALVQSETPAIGMSHVILARKSADGMVVEQIHEVISVDAVVFPATTRGFRESFLPAAEGEPVGDAEVAPEDLERQLEELRCELAGLTAERDHLRDQCDALLAEVRQQDVERELAAANLTGELITASLRDRLLSTADAAARKRLIAEHQEFVTRCRRRVPSSRPRASPNDDQRSVLRQIVQAVKGSR